MWLGRPHPLDVRPQVAWRHVTSPRPCRNWRCQAPPSHCISRARAVAVDQRRLRQVPCPATAALNQPPNWGGLSSISNNWREWRKREGDGAPQEPKGAGIWPAPLLHPLVEFYLAASRPCLGAGCPEGKLPKRRALIPGNRTLARLLERQGLERIPAAPGRKR